MNDTHEAKTKARVLTVYNCGTCYDRSNSQELIASLALRTSGSEGRDWIINPGPGSTGLFYKSVRARIAAGLITVVSSQPVDGFGSLGRYVVEGYGAITGSGRSVNIDSTLRLIRSTHPTCINMVGWSRGAITCIEIANKIVKADDIPAIPINLFLVDPVPGPHVANCWNWKTICTQIPSIVKECSAILQEGDRRSWMTPLTGPVCGDDPGRHPYPMPGPHSASVEAQMPFEPVARIARFLVESFLAGHGTKLSGMLSLSGTEICDLYGQMMLVVGDGVGRTAERADVPNEYRDSLIFVNAHHYKQCGLVFPTVAKLFNNLNSTNISPSEQQMVKAEAKRMRRDAPNAWRAFARGLFMERVKSLPLLDVSFLQSGGAIGGICRPSTVSNPPGLRRMTRLEFLTTQFQVGSSTVQRPEVD